MAIYAGGDVVDMRKAIVLNPVAETLFERLLTGTDTEELVQALLSTYDITEETARRDIALFVQSLAEKGLLDQ